VVGGGDDDALAFEPLARPAAAQRESSTKLGTFPGACELSVPIAAAAALSLDLA
jgi:hypothetical protein